MTISRFRDLSVLPGRLCIHWLRLVNVQYGLVAISLKGGRAKTRNRINLCDTGN